MQTKAGGNADGHLAPCEAYLGVGILRLRGCYASRTGHCAQEDTGTEVCYQDLFRYRPIRLVGLRRVTVAGADEADTPNAIVCYMQVFAELVDDMHADIAMPLEKMK